MSDDLESKLVKMFFEHKEVIIKEMAIYKAEMNKQVNKWIIATIGLAFIFIFGSGVTFTKVNYIEKQINNLETFQQLNKNIKEVKDLVKEKNEY